MDLTRRWAWLLALLVMGGLYVWLVYGSGLLFALALATNRALGVRETAPDYSV